MDTALLASVEGGYTARKYLSDIDYGMAAGRFNLYID